MNPLTSIFGAGVALRNRLYDRGILKAHKLRGRVVSVGNISAGGSGKTPFVIMLGELLLARGISFDVLSRGYGRRSTGVALVDPSGSAQQFGDEPLLIARKLGVPVVLGEDRHKAGVFAEREFGPQLHLLDDGFQHRGLARDFDIVLSNADDFRDRLLPAGRLREPPASLQRASAIVISEGGVMEPSLAHGRPVWRVQRGIEVKNPPNRPIVFCGIARPEKFVDQLRAAGITPAGESFYRDHHSYVEQDLRNLLQMRERANSDGFITTEKDAINLGDFRERLNPLAVIPVTMKLLDAENVLDAILGSTDCRAEQ